MVLNNFLVIAEYAALNQKAVLLRNSLEFLSSLQGRAWHSNPKLLQQIPGIGQVSSIRLFNSGIKSINAVRRAESSRLEVILKRNPPFGKKLLEAVKRDFPGFDFHCEMRQNQIFIKSKCSSDLGKLECAHILVIAYDGRDSGSIVFYDKIPVIPSEFSKVIDISSNKQISFSCSLMFEKWSGLNQNVCFDVKPDEEDEPINVESAEECSNIDKSCDLPEKVTLSKSKNQEAVLVPSPVSVKATPVKANGCKHTCKDKFLCAHPCCKAGLLKRGSESPFSPSKRTKLAQNNRSNFLAGSHRSLANARAYLQKYRPVNIFYPAPANGTITEQENSSDLFEEIEFELR